MKTKKYKATIPQIGESIFDILYLIFDVVAAIIFFVLAKGNRVLVLFGVLTLLLGGGDSFHLIPRIMDHLKGADDKRTWYMQLGVAVSSVTMTIFYILLFIIFKELFPDFKIDTVYTVLIWGTAIFRIIVCRMPQNGWFTEEENLKWSLIRNVPFAITGIMVMLLYFQGGTVFGVNFAHMGIAIILSFGFYIPVTIFAKKKPWVGALMMPKTLAYIWMISLGLKLAFNMPS